MFQRCMIVLVVTILAGCVSTPANKFGFISPSTRSALDGTQPIFIEAMPGKGFSMATSADTAVLATGLMFGAIAGRSVREWRSRMRTVAGRRWPARMV